ncbi:DUF1206 domain-containing protein, partial [Streptomyces nigra]
QRQPRKTGKVAEPLPRTPQICTAGTGCCSPTDRAKGLDDTLRSLAETPLGPWLLVCVAVGLVLFGLFSFALARWRRV